LLAAKAAVGAREVPRRHHATLRLPRFRVERVIHHSRGRLEVLAIAGTGYGIIGILVIILLVVLIFYFLRRA
jgi:hypothetical protein